MTPWSLSVSWLSQVVPANVACLLREGICSIPPTMGCHHVMTPCHDTHLLLGAAASKRVCQCCSQLLCQISTRAVKVLPQCCWQLQPHGLVTTCQQKQQPQSRKQSTQQSRQRLTWQCDTEESLHACRRSKLQCKDFTHAAAAQLSWHVTSNPAMSK